MTCAHTNARVSVLTNTFGGNNSLKVKHVSKNKGNIMGDKSPKSVQKKSAQKQSQNDVVNKKKQDLITSQQATKAKAATLKKK